MSGELGEAGLPRVDEHCVEVDATPERVWQALTNELAGGPSRGTELVAAVLGCPDRRVEGAPDRPGSTLVGFHVVRAQRPVHLALAGRHRFSRYALIFSLHELGGGDRCRLQAATRASFPGPHGRAYRAMVVGSGMHARLVPKLLRRIARRAQEAK